MRSIHIILSLIATICLICLLLSLKSGENKSVNTINKESGNQMENEVQILYEKFKNWHKEFKRDEKYQIDSEEGIKRFNIFKQNHVMIEEHNKKFLKKKLGEVEEGPLYTLGYGPFTDMSPEEFRSKMYRKIN